MFCKWLKGILMLCVLNRKSIPGEHWWRTIWSRDGTHCPTEGSGRHHTHRKRMWTQSQDTRSPPHIFIYVMGLFFHQTFPHSFIHCGYFYSASSSLLLRGAPNYSIDTVPELIRRRATGNYKWRTCPRSLRVSYSGIRTNDHPNARH